MLGITIMGAAGRMGKRLIANVMAADDMKLSGAVEHPQSPWIGKDAAATAGLEPCGIPIVPGIRDALAGTDVVIDFSTGPVVETAGIATAAGAAIVIGTTALDDSQKKELASIAGKGGRIVFAPNMSVGVNLLFALCAKAAAVLDERYDIEVVEMHHNQKKDAPSGTAVRLAEILAQARSLSYADDVRHGRQGLTGARTRREIGMHALRGGDVVGDHTVIFATEGERIELTHKASSRDTFACGALRAARFLKHAKPGLYDMQDVLGLR